MIIKDFYIGEFHVTVRDDYANGGITRQRTNKSIGRAPLQNTDKESEVRTVKKDQEQRLKECLMNFVERVANGGATTESEVQVLPAVAQVLLNLGAPSTEVTLDAKAVAKAIHDMQPTCFVKEED